MPKIDMPRRQQVPSGRAPVARMSFRPRMKEGAAREQLGAALADLGGDFATIGSRMQALRIQEELATAQTTLLDAEGTYKTGPLRDVAHLKRADEYSTWVDGKYNEIAVGLETPSAKDQFKLWADRRRVNIGTQIAVTSQAEYVRFVRADAQRKLQIYIREGDKESAYNDADVMLATGTYSPAEADLYKIDYDEGRADWVHKAALITVEKQIDEALEGGTYEEVKPVILEALANPDLWVDDKDKLLSFAERLDNFHQEKRDIETIKEEAELVDDLFTRLVEKQHISPFQIEESKILSKPDTWKKIADKQIRSDTPTKWETYDDLWDDLFTHWDDDTVITGAELKTSLAEARYADGKFSKADFAWFASLITKEIPSKDRSNLRKVFASNRDNLWLHTDTNTERLSRWNKAVFEWTLNQISRGKDLELENVLAMAKALKPDISRPPAMKWLPKEWKGLSPSEILEGKTGLGRRKKTPMTQGGLAEILDSLEGYLESQTEPADLITDLRAAIMAIRTGRDKKIIFQRIVEKYEGRAELQSFMNKVIEPLTGDEVAFQVWYKKWAEKLGLSPNPDDPRHFYDYRAAFRAGATPDKTGHWPSKYKLPGHPRYHLR